MPSIRTYYEILEVPYDADEATLRRAYRRAMQSVHPDQNPDGKRAARRARHLNAAKETLLDAEKRKRYDAKLRRRGLIPPDLPQKTNPDFSAPTQSQSPSQDSPVNQSNPGFQFAPESRRPPGGSTRGDFDYGKPLGRRQFRSGNQSRKPGFRKSYQPTRTPAQFVNTKNVIAAFCVTACLILIALFPWKEIQKTVISWAQPAPSPPGIPQPITPKPITPKPITPKPITPKPITPKPITPKPIAPKRIAPKRIAPQSTSPRPNRPGPTTPAPKPVKTTPPTTNPPATSATIIEAKLNEVVRVGGLNKQVIVRGPCNELTVSGNGYQIAIENMVSGKIKLSGLDHELEIQGTVSEIIGSGLRHHITAEEVGRVLMSGSGHKLYYKQGTGGLPVEGIPQEKSLDSRGSFSEIKKI